MFEEINCQNYLCKDLDEDGVDPIFEEKDGEEADFEKENILVHSKNYEKFLEFFQKLNSHDTWEDSIDINTIHTGVLTDENGDSFNGIQYYDAYEDKHEARIFDMAIPSMERISEDTAKGHARMTTEQILNSMNNYWGLFSFRYIKMLFRGKKMLSMFTNSYSQVQQDDIMEIIKNNLNQNHPDKWSFKKGFYTHAITNMDFEVKYDVTKYFHDAWINDFGGHPLALKNAHIKLHVVTNDIGTNALKIYIKFCVGDSEFDVGNPIRMVHRQNRSSVVNKFNQELSGIIATTDKETNLLANLMKIECNNPRNTLLNILRAYNIPHYSIGACRELVNAVYFRPTENMYVIYSHLMNIFHTPTGKNLNNDIKLSISTRLRKMLTDDLKKFDKTTAKEI